MGGGADIMLSNNANTSIARELIYTMEQQLLQSGINKIDLFVSIDNLKALQLYKNLDFKEQRKLMIKDIYE